MALPASMPIDFTSRNGELQLNGQRFYLKGVNWFGFETETKVVHGIWSFSLTGFLDFLVEHSFNAIRIPFAAELAFELDTFLPTAVNTSTNPDLQSKTCGYILDVLIREAANRGICILLDMHRLTAQAGITDLWHMPGFPEARLIDAWSIMASRYQDSWNVFAYDLKNEPHDSATWGDGNMQTDWRLAAERLGNKLLEINPRALIFVEGSSGKQVPRTTPEAAFWGGSLASARESPVRLSNPSKLVYSPHVYGPGVYMQEYFKDSSFPRNMPSIWTRQWGHLLHTPKAGPAVVTGEWGGFFRQGDLEQTWVEAFVDYLKSIGATDHFFWCLNPNSGDTGGVLEDDWRTPVAYKLDLMHRLCPSPSRIIADKLGNPREVIFGGCHQQRPAPPLSQIQDPASVSQQPGAHEQPAGNDGHGSGSAAEDLANMASLLDIAVDCSPVPGLSGSAKVVKTWTDGSKGQQFQIECNVVNKSSRDIDDLYVELPGDAGVAQIWNMTEVRSGVLYSLPKWATQYGGLKVKQPLSWGGIVSNPNTRLRYLPRTGTDHEEL